MTMRAKSCLAIAVAFVGLTEGIAFAQDYSLTNIIAPTYAPGSTSEGSLYAQGINASGEVTGYFGVTVGSTPVTDSFIAQAGGAYATSTITGYSGGNISPYVDPTDYPTEVTYNIAINSSGVTAGAGQDNNGFGVVTGPGNPVSSGLTDLGNLGGTHMVFGAAINSGGVIVGSSAVGNRFHALVIGPDSTGAYSQPMQTLSKATNSAAYGVNNSGTIVGFTSNPTSGSTTNSNAGRTGDLATEWTETSPNNWSQTTIADPATQLGNAGGQSIAYAVNNSGDFVGFTDSSHGSTAFLELAGGKVIDLDSNDSSNPISGSPWAGTYDSWAMQPLGGDYNILNVGFDPAGAMATAMTDELPNGTIEIVGTLNGGFGGDTGELWTVNLATDGVTATPLESLLPSAEQGNGLGQWELAVPTGINDSGQIVGVGALNGGEESFVITPPTSVPEPSMSLFAVAGIGGLLTRRVGRRLG